MSFGQEIKDFISGYKDTSKTIADNRETRAHTRYLDAMADNSEEGTGGKSGFGLQNAVDRIEKALGHTPKTHGYMHGDKENKGNQGDPYTAPGSAPVASPTANTAVSLSPSEAAAKAQNLPLTALKANSAGITPVAPLNTSAVDAGDSQEEPDYSQVP